MNYAKENLDTLSKFTHEEICEELYAIKLRLMWLENAASLTKDQWVEFNSINNKIKTLLGCKRSE